VEIPPRPGAAAGRSLRQTVEAEQPDQEHDDAWNVRAGETDAGRGERGDHERELAYRTDEFLPIGMDPVQLDRTTFDLYRMGRR